MLEVDIAARIHVSGNKVVVLTTQLYIVVVFIATVSNITALSWLPDKMREEILDSSNTLSSEPPLPPGVGV